MAPGRRVMTVERHPFELLNGDGDPIRGDVWSGAGARNDTAIVICHGFKGFKDWGFFPFLAQRLAEETGRPAVAFNTSGNGIGADLQSFTELDKFERNTFSKELDDLRLVLDAAEAGDLPGLGRRHAFGLLGHSRGGMNALVTASEDDRVRCLVTWAAIAYVHRWPEERKAEWRRLGRIEILNARTKQMMPLGLGLLEDAEQNTARLDPLKAAAALAVPYLVIHGAADESVPVREAELLADAAARETARLEVIEGAGHTFGAVHPFAGSTEHLDRVVGLSAAWFADHLKPAGD
ncbi:MAG: alpha/beta fold hydrolase [Gemmatimonadota bacterium]|nr:MAG: alpha/beta fold hydrolase [Gemmatimonadota bacterium]